MTATDWQALAAVRYASARGWYATIGRCELGRQDCPDCAACCDDAVEWQRSAAEASAQARKLTGVE